MKLPLPKVEVDKLKKRGIELADEQYTYFLLMALGQFEGAVSKNNTKAFELLTNIVGQVEVDSQDRTYRLPADLLSSQFVDVNRYINNREYKEFAFRGGRGSTKSSYVGLKIVELIKANPNIHGLITRKYANTLRDSVYAQVSWAISEIEDEHNWTKTTSPMQIVHKPTGQIIYFRGGDEPEKIKSIKPPFGQIALLWFEEADQFAGEEQMRNIKQSAIRGGDDGLVFLSYNVPRSRSHWINKYTELGKPNMLVHTSDYTKVPREWLGNFFLEEAEILKELNPKAYEHEYMGVAVGDGSTVFENIELRELGQDVIDRFDYIYHGQDWGWFPDPNILVAMSYDANRRELYIYREEVGNKHTNEMWADRILDLKNYTIVADSAEMKSINDFKALGFDMRPAIKGPNSVHEGIKWLAGLTKIVIDPVRCPKTASEFLNYEFEKDKEGNPITGYPDKDNHSIDAVRYAMEVVWRRRGL